jgi:putative membrane protein
MVRYCCGCCTAIFGARNSLQPLGAAAVSGNLSTSATGGSWSLADIPSTQRNILDWLRLISSSSDLNQLAGQEADGIGFVYTESTYDPSTFMAVRFTISCCVADASAIGLPVIWSESPSLAQGIWVRVQGTMQLGNFQGKEQLIIQANRVEIVEQPENPYLYP